MLQGFQLHQKVLQYDLEGVTYWINQKVNINELDDKGHTPLHWAVFGVMKTL